jgi:folate-binding protein YgfZ
VPADEPDAGVAAAYGDPLAEQRRRAADDGWVDLSHRDVVRISGADRLRWLNDLTTQKLDNLAPGVGTQALVLNPQGHIEHHFWLVDDGEVTWAHVEAGEGDPLVAFLESMRFMLRVEVADATAEWAVVWQPSSEPNPRLLDRSELASFADVAAPVGVQALEALRIEAGRPRFGVDTDHRTIPHEVGWIGSAVQLNKGCYRGQETVARVANLGRPPRRLVRLHLDGSVRETLPPRGTAVFLNGDNVGQLTSSAYHYELGPIGLALVKYATADDIDVVVGEGDGGISARLEAVVARDDTPRPGQAARAAFRRSLL